MVEKTSGEKYGYDIMGNLTSIIGNGINQQFEYNGNGHRMSKTDDGETIYYVNDVNLRYEQVLQTYNDSGIIDTYSYGVERIQSVGETNETYLYDGRGSVVGVINQDNILESYSYTAYGELMPTSPQPKVWGYNGEATDSETGMQYLRARYYNPNIGRFEQRDTWRGIISEIKSLNRYGYALNNPVLYNDDGGNRAVRVSKNDARTKDYEKLVERQNAKRRKKKSRESYKTKKSDDSDGNSSGGGSSAQGSTVDIPSAIYPDWYVDVNTCNSEDKGRININDYIYGNELLCNVDNEYLTDECADNEQLMRELFEMSIDSTVDKEKKQHIQDWLQYAEKNNFDGFELVSLKKEIYTSSNPNENKAYQEAYDLAYKAYNISRYEDILGNSKDKILKANSKGYIMKGIGKILGGLAVKAISTILTVNDTIKQADEETSKGAPKPGVYYEFEIDYSYVSKYSSGDSTFVFIKEYELEGQVGPGNELSNPLNSINSSELITNPMGTDIIEHD